MKKIVLIALMACFVQLNAGLLYAVEASKENAVEQSIKLLRQDLRSDKKQIVAANIQLTEAESLKFWPVYDAYTVETTKLNDTLQALIIEYARNYETMTDEKIMNLTKKTLELDVAVTKLRIKYVPLFNRVIPAKKTTRFMQIDRRLGLLMNIQLASGLPLVQP